jgi:hypothetical protein
VVEDPRPLARAADEAGRVPVRKVDPHAAVVERRLGGDDRDPSQTHVGEGRLDEEAEAVAHDLDGDPAPPETLSKRRERRIVRLAAA